MRVDRSLVIRHWCLVIAALLLITSIALAQGGAPSPADMQFTFAVRLMRQQDMDLATQAFEHFIRDFGDDARVGDAHYYLAVLKRQQGDRPGAMTELNKAKKPEYVSAGAVALLKGQLLLEGGDAKAALAVLEPIDAGQFAGAPDTAANWHYLLGAAYRGAGNNEAAGKQFALAAGDGSPVKQLALVELAKTRVQAKQWKAASATLKQAIDGDAAGAKPQAAPGTVATALQLAGAVAEQLKDWRAAAGYYQRIVRDYQTSAQFNDAAVGWLRALFNSGDEKQVIGRAGELAKLVGDDAAKLGVAYWHAAALLRQGNYDAAEKVCEARLGPGRAASGTEDLQYLHAVAQFHMDAAGFQSWHDTGDLSKFTVAQRDHLRYLRAEAEPDESKAIAMLGPLVDQPDSSYAKAALLMRAKLYEKVGRTDQAAADYQRYGKDYADDGQATAATAYAVDLAMADGEYDKAVTMIDRIVKPDAAMQLKLAVALIKLGRNDEARKALDDLLAEGSGADARTRALAMYYKGLLLVPVEVKEGTDVSAAIELMKQAMAGDLPAEQKLEALAVTARVQRMSGQAEEAIKTYQKLRDVDPKGKFDGATALWVGRGLLEGGDAKAAEPWFDAAMSGVKTDDPLWAAAMFGKAQSLRIAGQYEKAIENYRKLLGYSDSYGERGRLGLAEALAASGKQDDAMEEFNGLLAAQASEVAATALMDSAVIEIGRAQAAARGGDEAGAKEHRTEGRRRLSRVVILYNQPELGALPVRAMVLLGRLEEAEGMRDKAREHFAMAGRQEDIEDAATGRTSKAEDVAAWRLVGQAEGKRLDGQVGDATFLFRKAAKMAGAGDAADYAKQRLKTLGETP